MRRGIKLVSNQRGYVLPGANMGGIAGKTEEAHEFDAALVVVV
jgi:hypothetical protein